MSPYTTQFQGPAMAATREQSWLLHESRVGCYTRAELLKTHVRIAGDRSAYRLSSGQISAETEATQTLTALEL